MLHLFISMMIAITLSGCGNASFNDTSLKEISILKNMVETVSQELSQMGFAIDPHKVNIEIKNIHDMAATFNQISGESKQDIKKQVLKGPVVVSTSIKKKADKPLFDDGASSRLAFYDPNSQTIVFIEGATKNLTKGYLAHELAHVYQDQKWGFDDIWQSYQDDPSHEQNNITQFIIEGHAELVRKAYEQRHAKDKKTLLDLSVNLGSISENDCIICNSNESVANLPYLLGMRFLVHQYQNGGWPLVESLFKELPSSSEQVIHPDKFKLDEPQEVVLPKWEDSKVTTKLILNSSLGEAFLLQKLLNLKVDKETALKAASGWDGDIAQIYKLPDKSEALVWRIIFDRVIDAKQLESAVSSLGKSYEIFRVGRVIDWIESKDVDIRKKLRIFLSKNPIFVEPIREDEKSTIEQEVSMKSDAALLLAPHYQPKIIIGPNSASL